MCTVIKRSLTPAATTTSLHDYALGTRLRTLAHAAMSDVGDAARMISPVGGIVTGSQLRTAGLIFIPAGRGLPVVGFTRGGVREAAGSNPGTVSRACLPDAGQARRRHWVLGPVGG